MSSAFALTIISKIKFFLLVKKKCHIYLVSKEYALNELGINLSFTGEVSEWLIKSDDCTKAVDD